MSEPQNKDAFITSISESGQHLSKKQTFLLERGHTLFNMQQYRKAKEYYEAGLKLDPDCEELQFALFLTNQKIEKLGKFSYLYY